MHIWKDFPNRSLGINCQICKPDSPPKFQTKRDPFGQICILEQDGDNRKRKMIKSSLVKFIFIVAEREIRLACSWNVFYAEVRCPCRERLLSSSIWFLLYISLEHRLATDFWLTGSWLLSQIFWLVLKYRQGRRSDHFVSLVRKAFWTLYVDAEHTSNQVYFNSQIFTGGYPLSIETPSHTWECGWYGC